jgi:predicted PolB exonuclease-like 3'-5' exonuclease
MVPLNNTIQTNISVGAYGPLPSDFPEKLGHLKEKFAQKKITLLLEGVSEGTLYYQLKTDEGSLCGAGGKMLHESFKEDVWRAYPSLLFKDTSPVAVAIT